MSFAGLTSPEAAPPPTQVACEIAMNETEGLPFPSHGFRSERWLRMMRFVLLVLPCALSLGCPGGASGGGGGGVPGSGGNANSTGCTTSPGGTGAAGSSGSSSGGATASSGGASSGSSAVAGGGGTAGSAIGGSVGAGGGSNCPFPTSFKWKDFGGPITTPKNGWVSLKDFTDVVYNGLHIVYMSTHDASAYGSAMMTFGDWSEAASAVQTKLPTSTVAPTLFYFTPKNTWILAYQWGPTKFSYATSSDPTKPTSWSFGHPLLSEDVTTGSPTGPIDQTLICDSTNCYLFYADDNGHIYRASMPIENFPGTFSCSTLILSNASLFEAVQVYAVRGTGRYLMIV
jgi:hypothetical protein